MKKKILITTGIFFPDIGGPASYTRIVTGELSKEAEITVLTYSDKFSQKSDRSADYKIVRVWRKTPKPFRQFIYLLRLFFLAGAADTIYSLSSYGTGYPSAIIARLRGKNLIVRVVGDRVWEGAVLSGRTQYMIDDFQKHERTGAEKRQHKIQTWVAKTAQTLIVPSHYLKRIVSGWGIDESRIVVIYNSTDFKNTTLTQEEARTKIGIHGSILLTAGRLVPWKGFRMLIKLMPKFLEMNSFARLVIVGSGPDYAILKAFVKNLNLEKKVIIVNAVPPEDLVVYFRASDIFILNTGYEGFSHLVLESMHLGTPVVTTGVGGNKEIIRQGENGFMVRYNDEFNILEAVKTLWNDKKLREMFVANGRETAKVFSKEKMIKEVKELLLR